MEMTALLVNMDSFLRSRRPWIKVKAVLSKGSDKDLGVKGRILVVGALKIEPTQYPFLEKKM